jgi:hypothetical protein
MQLQAFVGERPDVARVPHGLGERECNAEFAQKVGKCQFFAFVPKST